MDCLELLALNVSSDFAAMNFFHFAKVLHTLLAPRCLGFAPRSESFAIEHSVQVCSFSSLSRLALRRLYANPLEPKGLPSLVVLIHYLIGCFLLKTRGDGFEPPLEEPESSVLPLDDPRINLNYYLTPNKKITQEVLFPA